MDGDDWPVILLNLLLAQRQGGDEANVEPVFHRHKMTTCAANGGASTIVFRALDPLKLPHLVNLLTLVFCVRDRTPLCTRLPVIDTHLQRSQMRREIVVRKTRLVAVPAKTAASFLES
jgi:hypothetical protein